MKTCNDWRHPIMNPKHTTHPKKINMKIAIKDESLLTLFFMNKPKLHHKERIGSKMAVELDMLSRPVVLSSSHIQRTKEKRGKEGEETEGYRGRREDRAGRKSIVKTKVEIKRSAWARFEPPTLHRKSLSFQVGHEELDMKAVFDTPCVYYLSEIFTRFGKCSWLTECKPGCVWSAGVCRDIGCQVCTIVPIVQQLEIFA